MTTEADVPSQRTPANHRSEATGRTRRQRRARAAIARMTSTSWREVPHFHVSYEADVTDLLERWRPTPLLLAALTVAVQRTESVRVASAAAAADDADDADEKIACGLLVSTNDGLLLPRIGGLNERLAPDGMAEVVSDAVKRARTGRLTNEDLGRRHFTLSNLGMFPVERFAGVIPVPDVVLVAAGKARVMPRWNGSTWEPRSIVNLTVTMDHRVLDGADAGGFLMNLDDALANPQSENVPST